MGARRHGQWEEPAPMEMLIVRNVNCIAVTVKCSVNQLWREVRSGRSFGLCLEGDD